MDFVTHLPRTFKKNDVIWVMVDRLTKSAHFLPIRETTPVHELAEIFQRDIVRLHGVPVSIVSDRDTRFTLRFWKGTTSDHSPILLIPQVTPIAHIQYRFKFENAWMTEPLCEVIVREGWQSIDETDILQKIKSYSQSLSLWGKEITGNFSGRIRECKAILKQYRGGRDDNSKEKFKAAKTELTKIFSQREIFWRQRSKQMWLQAGDQNSKYFHSFASNRRRNNQIDKLKNEDGQWLEWESGLAELISNHFSTLFTATEVDWQEVVNFIPSTITSTQNYSLLHAITVEEVKCALFQMNPDKAPGPDGMTPGFYQKYWHIVGDDVVKLVQNFFSSGRLMEELNNTNIVLIPKKKCPIVVGYLRPISLCNVLVKIVTKVIANRLKGVLDKVISENQSAFLSGRLISDNVMIAYEVMHMLKRKRRGRDSYMALKLDMSKAYDRIEWSYLNVVLSKMGFDSWWVHLIMQCVKTVSYSIVHSRREIGPISPSRGLRQGDPLSPYLFILCAEGLSAMLHQYERRKLIQGVKVCKQAPSITHMLFADDSYLYCKAGESEAHTMMEILRKFELASGQKVNKLKSSVFFSTNTGLEKKNQICDIIQMGEADENCSYLGLPNMMKRSKSATLGFLKDQVRRKASIWDGKIISKGGKEVLVKSVIQALPTYAMSVFLLPSDITKDFERSISRFWWNSKNNDSRSIHWMSYQRLSRHKACGGMGFRDFRDFNIAMLGKQGWRFITNPNSLVSRIYKARYFAECNFLEARIGNNPSFIWRSIWEAKHVISAGMRWKIGSGNSVNIVGQPWLLDDGNPFITSNVQGLENYKVSALMAMDSRGWDEEILRDMFNVRDQQCIKQIQLVASNNEDVVYWGKEVSGHYTVRSAYRLLQEQKDMWNSVNLTSTWRKTWRIKSPPEMLNFMWRSLSNCLPTMMMLRQKNVDVNSLCQVCRLGDETVDHILCHCEFARQCWSRVLPRMQYDGCTRFFQWWEKVFEDCNNEKRAEVVSVCWSLWKARNDLIWNRKYTRVNVVLANAKQGLLQWILAQKKVVQPHFSHSVEGDGSELWVAPQMDHMKISVDAAIFPEHNAYGVGFVVRNDRGELVQARTKCSTGLDSPYMAEAIAIKEALSWIQDRGWSKIVVESDCLTAVQAVRSKVPMRSPFGDVIQSCRNMLASFNTVSLFFIKRSANMAAHELARLSFSFPDRVFDRMSVPIEVKNVLRRDYSV
ncbi:uncharacterized protein LOC141685724 [Apium graveolens]|uniref:uncharacterized protein LOC141685724 n=1 Tax=Apium graveolens TaxID=4045 RepID=UPI003D7992F7